MLIDQLKTIYSDHQVLINEPMMNHTSFKIGGNASYIVLPNSIHQIQDTLAVCRAAQYPCLIMGNGSNILVEDTGIDAVIIKITDSMSTVTIENGDVVAESGVLLSKLARLVMKESLIGFEFASGIPGTLGGAVFMNAGAYGGEMKDVVKWIEVITTEGELLRFENEHIEFGYRTSIVREKGWIVVRVGLHFEKGDPEEIRSITNDLTQKRVSKQPLELPSAGSTFKRPPGYFAGQLIEDAGLRGLQHGGAQVSEKHCGFVVNTGNATFSDVMNLILTVQKVVFDQFGVELEREVRIFGKE